MENSEGSRFFRFLVNKRELVNLPTFVAFAAVSVTIITEIKPKLFYFFEYFWPSKISQTTLANLCASVFPHRSKSSPVTTTIIDASRLQPSYFDF